ncbi:glycine/betaine ABC transporter substrate-binding protein [Filobacillus milosensis]|uniref:Glycine/betaine ABC transporter substrate-binding protein n=1 Tax=Filobacillus milosensis TaxID=94137 RepID=A0A4Y8IN74_9BACI|nr:glycine betaine ABC transporter substrate-binding protein [Filobacillus milosensis]TFB22791.1 glycine/betaine ABC transporter substrate-binding protein [Filobacillus milosensis]
MKKLYLALVAIAMVSLLAACGSDSKENGEGGIELEMGAQSYTDPKIIAQMVKAKVEQETDHTVNITEDIQASPQIISALDQGEFDLGTLYSGELYNNHFDEEKVEFTTDTKKTLEQAQKLFSEKFGIKWYDSLGFQNKYSIAVTKEIAEKHGVEKISDLSDLAGDLVLGTDTSWPNRENDGYRAFQEAYGYEFSDVRGMEASLMYEGVEAGELDVVTAYTVDPQIIELDLKVLKDDRQFFPPYQASLVGREDTLEKYPEVDKILQEFIGTITEEEMTQLIYEVDIEGRSTEEVAKEFLKEKGLLE